MMNFFKAEEDDEEAAGRSAPVGRRLLASTRLLDDRVSRVSRPSAVTAFAGVHLILTWAFINYDESQIKNHCACLHLCLQFVFSHDDRGRTSSIVNM